MEPIEICTECKKRPIYIKKRGLCLTCYRKFRKEKGPLININSYNYSSKHYAKNHNLRGEIEFVKNFFNHKNWIHHPGTFYFNGNDKYSPDFYDAERNCFIEVVGSRQAYHQNKEKYEKFRRFYPEMHFEIRQSDGSLLNENDRNKNWNNDNKENK